MEEESHQDLIPGLPADIARECLTRLPYTHFPTLRLTSSLWRHELHSESFHSHRKSNHLTRPLIALLHSVDPTAHHKAPAAAPIYRLTLFDPSTAKCHPLPPIPDHPFGLPVFARITPVFARITPVLRGIAVFGGWDPQTWAATDGVFIFDLVSSSWRRGARMPGTRRSFFGCAASDSGQAVVVAGGHDEMKDALRSAMVYDVEKDEWAPLPDMKAERDECTVVFQRGRFWAVGGYRTEAQGRFSKSGEAFDFDKWEWGPVEEGFLDSATCPRTCTAGNDCREVYICEGGHVAVREEGSRGWRKVAALPADVRTALQLVTWEGRVMVMGSGMQGGTQACYVLEEQEKGKRMTWRKVEMPPEYSGHVQAACCLEI